MKNIIDIYEGVLSNIDDNIDSAETFIKNVNIEFEILKKELGIVKSKSFNNKYKWRGGTHLYTVYCKNLLASIGIDGETLCVNIFNPGIKSLNCWVVEIFIYKSNGAKINTVTSKKLSFNENEYKNLNDIIKNIIKPNISTIADFKKFITE